MKKKKDSLYDIDAKIFSIDMYNYIHLESQNWWDTTNIS